jgi:hypothetical protein
VAIDAAPIKGVLSLPISALRVASIALRKPANRNLAISLTAEQFRYGFGNVLPEQESAELYDRWTVPSPGKPLFEAALANFTPGSPAKVDTANKTRGPLLLTAGGNDHTVPAAITTSTRKQYHKSPAITDFIEFPDRGHSLTIDHGWREVAQAALDWLRQRSLLSGVSRAGTSLSSGRGSGGGRQLMSNSLPGRAGRVESQTSCRYWISWNNDSLRKPKPSSAVGSWPRALTPARGSTVTACGSSAAQGSRSPAPPIISRPFGP